MSRWTLPPLSPGEPAPDFFAPSPTSARYHFHTVAGRYVLLVFLPRDPAARGAATAAFLPHRRLADDQLLSVFFVVTDPEGLGSVRNNVPGVRCFLDADGEVSRLYGARTAADKDAPFWLLLDPALRVVASIPFAPDGSDGKAVFELLRRLPPPGGAAGAELPVPVLWLPNVFEPELCQTLIAAYERHGGEESGFMRDVDGQTKLIHDHWHKRRRDFIVEDADLIKTIQNRVLRRIKPEIQKVHHFDATRMERYLVACYRAEDGGHFRPHRDNTTKGTAHRRFAVSINLNEDFEGGDLSFPEFGPREFRPPVGGAVVFSCSLMHAVSPVTKGRRFAFLPFLYDEAASKIRAANQHFLGAGYEYTP